jgi:Lamin Tail Domain
MKESMQRGFVALLLLALAAMATASVALAELRITEALSAPATDWDGDGAVDFKGDEWVEILNTGPAPEDLDGVFLKDGTGDAYHYGFSGILGVGDVLVVYGSEAVAWQAANSAGSSGLSLNNGGDMVELWRDTLTPRIFQALDVVPIPSHAAGADRALGWSENSTSWLLHDAANPYSGAALPAGSGCAPSPGVRNACDGLVPVENARWGGLKSRYGGSHRGD